ncbi:MAG: helix-turn-helix domain-containing protein [Zoogloea sp.]|uniref:helix-turn-helix domain-containing protein n=1 Tax=Zoogloea sp. TaxID=49181 RepID=UPI003F32D4CF
MPRFSLYGEEETRVEREFVHIEDISARSAARNWQIDTHTHGDLLQVLFVFSGTARVHLEGSEQDCESPLAVVIPPGVIHAFKFLPGTQGYVLTLDAEGMAGASPDGTQMFSVLRGNPEIISLDEPGGASPQRFQGLLAQIEAEFQNPGPASTALFAWLVRALLLLLVREHMNAENTPQDHVQALLENFRRLVESHFLDHWPIPRYAEALNVTESRLNRLCQKRYGQSAFILVRDRLLLEARRRLIYTGVPVSQLAYELGFSDPPYFCRFFKKLTGQTPNAFRAQNPSRA